MTTHDLDPQSAEELRRVADLKNTALIAPIDVSANEFVEKLAAQTESGDISAELHRESVGFVTKLVGYSSKNIDAETGQYHVATIDRNDEDQVRLDQIGLSFLVGNPNVLHSELVSETHAIDQFYFHQARQSGKVREVTVHRKQPLGQDSALPIEYCLTFSDIALHRPEEEERILAQGRAYLEYLGKEGIALAARGMELPLDAIKATGHLLVQIGRTDDSA
ncbi:hypothetical protein BH09PAT4_BH09PAT4_05720 [soil metagenome]